MNHELTELADADIVDVLSATATTFGVRQLEIYAAIIAKGVALVAEEPRRPGSVDRPDLGPNVRLFHLELAAGRRGGAAHCLYYTTGRLSDGSDGVIVLRVLHERMDPGPKVAPPFQ